MAGAAGSLPEAKSSPHTSQNPSSGVRVAPQFGHTDAADTVPAGVALDGVAPDGVAGAAVADPGAGLNAAPQLSQ
jgi:hypothetical protein